MNSIFSFFKCWPIGDPFYRLGSLSTPPTGPTLNLDSTSFYLIRGSENNVLCLFVFLSPYHIGTFAN